MVRLAIIEDTQTVREILTAYFSEQPDFQLVTVAETAEYFLEAHLNKSLDMVLCDIGLPGKSGTEATWAIKRKFPHIRVVMFTVFEDKEKIFESLKAGASGYLLKKTPLTQIKSALLDVMNEGAAMSPSIALKVIEYFKVSTKLKDSDDALTPREIEVVEQIKQGFGNKEIGENLFISVDTVKYHIRKIYEKLQVRGRVELINYYQGAYD